MPSDEQNESSGYVIDPENAAEMARLSKLAQHLSEGMGLFPQALDLTRRPRLLDIGCGPGEWVMEMARQYPAHQALGLDISALMIRYAQMCAQTDGIGNVEFVHADARQPLPVASEHVDVVHARMASSWLKTTLWLPVLREYWRVLKPGGIVCCTEYENLGISTSLALTRLNRLSLQAMRRTGQCFTPDGDSSGVTVLLPSLLQDAGFAHMQQEAHAVPYGYGTPAHLTMIENLTIGLRLMQPFLLGMGVASQEELMELYDTAVREMRREDFRATVSYLRVWGEKKHSGDGEALV